MVAISLIGKKERWFFYLTLVTISMSSMALTKDIYFQKLSEAQIFFCL